MNDIRLTINSDLSVTIYEFNYEFNKESEEKCNLIDIIEKFYKNSKIKINEIIVNKEDLTKTELKLINLLRQPHTNLIGINVCDSNLNEIFEAQILIPYRAKNVNSFRKEQLHKFLKHMNNYLNKVHPMLKYKLIIMEQNNEHMFNRGILLNIGFLEREKAIDYKIKYYIHHNCDLFPSIEQNPCLDYSYTPVNEVRDIYGYSGGIGGIAIFNRLTFLQINGFPNDYFNWGAEDTTLYQRCIKNSIDIKRTLYNVGVHEETHIRDSSFNNINTKKGQKDTPKTNGLTTCNYKCEINNESEFKYDNVIHYLVDFDYIC